MCKQNQLFGFVLIAFGAGVLLGCWLTSEFFATCAGIGAVALGVLILHKK